MNFSRFKYSLFLSIAVLASSPIMAMNKITEENNSVYWTKNICTDEAKNNFINNIKSLDKKNGHLIFENTPKTISVEIPVFPRKIENNQYAYEYINFPKLFENKKLKISEDVQKISFEDFKEIYEIIKEKSPELLKTPRELGISGIDAFNALCELDSEKIDNIKIKTWHKEYTIEFHKLLGVEKADEYSRYQLKKILHDIKYALKNNETYDQAADTFVDFITTLTTHCATGLTGRIALFYNNSFKPMGFEDCILLAKKHFYAEFVKAIRGYLQIQNALTVSEGLLFLNKMGYLCGILPEDQFFQDYSGRFEGTLTPMLNKFPVGMLSELFAHFVTPDDFVEFMHNEILARMTSQTGAGFLRNISTTLETKGLFDEFRDYKIDEDDNGMKHVIHELLEKEGYFLKSRTPPHYEPKTFKKMDVSKEISKDKVELLKEKMIASPVYFIGECTKNFDNDYSALTNFGYPAIRSAVLNKKHETAAFLAKIFDGQRYYDFLKLLVDYKDTNDEGQKLGILEKVTNFVNSTEPSNILRTLLEHYFVTSDIIFFRLCFLIKNKEIQVLEDDTKRRDFIKGMLFSVLDTKLRSIQGNEERIFKLKNQFKKISDFFSSIDKDYLKLNTNNDVRPWRLELVDLDKLPKNDDGLLIDVLMSGCRGSRSEEENYIRSFRLLSYEQLQKLAARVKDYECFVYSLDNRLKVFFDAFKKTDAENYREVLKDVNLRSQDTNNLNSEQNHHPYAVRPGDQLMNEVVWRPQFGALLPENQLVNEIVWRPQYAALPGNQLMNEIVQRHQGEGLLQQPPPIQYFPREEMQRLPLRLPEVEEIQQQPLPQPLPIHKFQREWQLPRSRHSRETPHQLFLKEMQQRLQQPREEKKVLDQEKDGEKRKREDEDSSSKKTKKDN